MGVGHSRESHGSLLGLGTPGSLTAVCWDWALREPHGSLWGWALQESHGSPLGLGTLVCGVGHSSETSLLGLGTPGSLKVVCGVGHSRESHGSLLGLGTPR